MTSVEHHRVPTQGIELHCVTAGPEDGVPVLMLHGFPEYWAGFSRQLGPLADAGYRLIVPDQRGYNTSDKPPRVSDYRVRTLAGDMLGLLDHFEVPRAHVVCHDWGGAVGWWLAAEHPDRVRRFCALNMGHPRVLLRHLFTRPGQLARMWYAGAFLVPGIERLLLADGCDRLVRGMYGNTATKPFTDDEIEGYRRAWTQPGAMKAMLSWYRCAFRVQGFLPGKRVTVPTLILWGSKDRALMPAFARASARVCDDARLVFVDDAAHFVQHDAPERVNAELLAFLGELG